VPFEAAGAESQFRAGTTPRINKGMLKLSLTVLMMSSPWVWFGGIQDKRGVPVHGCQYFTIGWRRRAIDRRKYVMKTQTFAIFAASSRKSQILPPRVGWECPPGAQGRLL